MVQILRNTFNLFNRQTKKLCIIVDLRAPETCRCDRCCGIAIESLNTPCNKLEILIS